MEHKTDVVTAGQGVPGRWMTIALAMASGAFSGLAIYLFGIYVEIQNQYRELSRTVPLEVLASLDRPVGRIRVYFVVVALAAFFGAVAIVGRPRGSWVGWVALTVAALSAILVSGMP